MNTCRSCNGQKSAVQHISQWLRLRGLTEGAGQDDNGIDRMYNVSDEIMQIKAMNGAILHHFGTKTEGDVSDIQMLSGDSISCKVR